MAVRATSPRTLRRAQAPSGPAVARRIPFCKPWIGAAEREAVLGALAGGALGGNGPIGRQVEQRLQRAFGAGHVLLTTSCTHAMEMAAMAVALQPGDEVIMPSFAFVTAATSVLRCGARPVFAEIDENTLNLDPEDALQRVTPRTRAILCVHYGGLGCDMDALTRLARERGLWLIEDAAQAVGARFNGRYLGTIGDAGCYSFHVTKNITCGEGGAFVTSDPRIADRAEILREKGTNRSNFLRGQVDKYTWVDQGSSFVLSDLLAALLSAQLDRLEDLQSRRRSIWQAYQDGLAPLAARGEIQLPYVDPRAEPNWHIYAFRVRDLARRDPLLERLRGRGVDATFHFVPLHSSPYARRHWGYRAEDLPVTERASAALVRLPLYAEMSGEDADYVVESVYQALAA